MNNAPYYLPGDRRHLHDMASCMRVDHAGEVGAVVIYQGQQDAAQQTMMSDDERDTLRHMHAQEIEHEAYFNELLPHQNIRPSLLYKGWQVAGYMLGFMSRKMGNKASYALTVAVEEAIDKHYQEQIDYLQSIPRTDGEDAFLQKIKQFQQEECEHRDIAINNKANEMVGFNVFYQCIQAGVRLSIRLAQKI